MTKYGGDYYGLGELYGAQNVTYIDYDVSPVVAFPYGFNSIKLSWNPPTGSWTKLAIVRNPYGFPINYDDGSLVFITDLATAPSYFIDEGKDLPNNSGLKSKSFYHYSIFLLTGSNTWAKAGTAYSLSVNDYGSSDYIYNNLIPGVYRTSTLGALTDQSDNADLMKFIDIFGFELDKYRTYVNLVVNQTESSSVYPPMIPAVLQQYGNVYEPELGIQQSRVYIKNAARIGRGKGSRAGLVDYLKSYSGYDQNITMGQNLFLDYNDSSFEESIGNWKMGNLNTTTGVWTTSASAGVLSLYLYGVTIPSKIPYVEPNASALYPNRIKGFLLAQNAQPGSFLFACGADNPMLKGIPVVGGSVYTFSAWMAAVATSRNVNLYVAWYTKTGTFINRSAAVGKTNTVWSFSTPWPSRAVGSFSAPSNAVFAVPIIEITGITVQGEQHYFDALQFEQSNAVTAFSDARIVNITMVAQRINSVLDPSFINGGTSWLLLNATSVQDLSYNSSNSSESLKLTPTKTLATTVAVRCTGVAGSNILTIDDGKTATFHGSVIGGATASTQGGVPNNTTITAAVSNSLSLSSTLTANVTSQVITFVYYTVKLETINFMPVLPGYWYTGSGFVRTGYFGSIDADRYGRFVVDWYDSNHVLINTVQEDPHYLTDFYEINTYSAAKGRLTLYTTGTHLFDLSVGNTIVISNLIINNVSYDGAYPVVYVNPTTIQVIASVPDSVQVALLEEANFQLQTSTFEQLHASYLSPNTAAFAKLRFEWVNPQTSQNVWVDNFMFERASTQNPYFDGYNGFSTTTDLKWEGTPNGSRSHYYRNLQSVQNRLIKEIPNYLMIGSSFQILVAQANTL